ncbi:MAG: S-adenosylmethionine:tRNA ribosyltransferase-isomerase, partial [Chitinophagales bacterium]
MHPKEISIQDFSYELPEDRIAKYPLSDRDESKLLVYHNRKILEDTYRHIADYIPENSLLL